VLREPLTSGLTNQGRSTVSSARWAKDVSPYQWTVFAVVCMAWGFDSLDQRVFSLARIPALVSLMHQPSDSILVQEYAKIATATFLLGWGIGGLSFGAIGDRFGRVRVLALSIFGYALCTGLTALVGTANEFVALRFATGLGIGGVFGLGVTVLAEAVPTSARPAMLAWMQVLSLVANVAAGFIKLCLDALLNSGTETSLDSWRWLFAVGGLPAIVGVFAFRGLRESDSWRRGDAERSSQGIFRSYQRLFVSRSERRGLLVGVGLSLSAIVGLWSVGEYAIDLQDIVFHTHYQFIAAADIPHDVASAKSIAFILQMVGGAAGMLLFANLMRRIGRRAAFVTGFAAAFGATIFVFASVSTPLQAYWMMPLMGATQFGLTAGLAIYLPELFPTSVRATGVSFAYNLGRFVAAGGGLVSATLTNHVFGQLPSPLPLRYAAISMSAIFIIGLLSAFAAPETRDSPLR
jgi:MFS family permease